MSEEDVSVLLIVLVAVVAVVGLGLGMGSVLTHNSVGGMMGGSNGGPMMGGGSNATTSTGPGVFEWGLLFVSAAFLVVAVVLLLFRARGGPRSPAMPPPMGVSMPPAQAVSTPVAGPSAVSEAGPTPSVPAAPAQAVPEPALMKLLDEDERRMYLELRDHGGMMLQRDLVALGTFSKAKVTRVLDKLETKGVVVREAHGMTNRVRIVSK